MENLLFIGVLTALLVFLYRWSFKTLPQERWQILGCVPLNKGADDQWRGVNLTYYGLFNANAYTLATLLLFILLAAVDVPITGVVALALMIMMICLPSARLLARIIEKKTATFTVAGAAFMGMLITPWVLFLMRRPYEWAFGFSLDIMAVMAAISVAYALGEGVGRLACISFGCCYGKPLEQVHPVLRRILESHAFTFQGKTKKIAYAHGYDRRKVVPVQALTVIIYTFASILGIYFYLEGDAVSAFIITLTTTQLWRFFSEFLRADHRGNGKISVYQWMSVVIIPYALGVTAFFADMAVRTPSLAQGLRSLWDPGLIIFFQLVWICVFLYTGRSQITTARLTFHVVEEKI